MPAMPQGRGFVGGPCHAGGTLVSRREGKVKICPVLSDRTGNNCPKGHGFLSCVPGVVMGKGGRTV
jgi:hypothetical protein